MGDERGKAAYTQAERREFHRRASAELGILMPTLLTDPALITAPLDFGDETETLLLAPDGRPLPVNKFVVAEAKRLGLPVVPELLAFQAEVNSRVWPFGHQMFAEYHLWMSNMLRTLAGVVEPLGGQIGLMGMLMSLGREDLRDTNISIVKPRYMALRTNLAALYPAFRIQLQGAVDSLDIISDDVALEGAATSLQTHRSVTPSTLPTVVNAAQVAAALLVAACEGSPLLLGRDLWAETRIPLFTEAVRGRITVGPHIDLGGGKTTWATKAEQVLAYCLRPGLEIILAELTDDPADALSHWRLAVGQDHAWVRPTLYPSRKLGVESRVKPAGPTVIDQAINHALDLGITGALAERINDWIIAGLPYQTVVQNLRLTAQYGLNAQGLDWPDDNGRPTVRSARDILLELVQEGAIKALHDLGASTAEAELMMSYAEERIRSGRTATAWIREAAAKVPGDTRAYVMGKITRIYLGAAHSRNGLGDRVSTWGPAADYLRAA